MRNGAPASPISVHKALLNCGVDVTAHQVGIFPRNFDHAKYVLSNLH